MATVWRNKETGMWVSGKGSAADSIEIHTESPDIDSAIHLDAPPYHNTVKYEPVEVVVIRRVIDVTGVDIDDAPDGYIAVPGDKSATCCGCAFCGDKTSAIPACKIKHPCYFNGRNDGRGVNFISNKYR